MLSTEPPPSPPSPSSPTTTTTPREPTPTPTTPDTSSTHSLTPPPPPRPSPVSALPPLPMPIPMPVLTQSESIAFNFSGSSQYGMHHHPDAVQVGHGHMDNWSPKIHQQLQQATKDLLSMDSSNWVPDSRYFATPASYSSYPNTSSVQSSSTPMHSQSNSAYSYNTQHQHHYQHSMPPTPTVAYPSAPSVAPNSYISSYSQPQMMNMGMVMPAPHLTLTPSPPHIPQQQSFPDVSTATRMRSLSSASAYQQQQPMSSMNRKRGYTEVSISPAEAPSTKRQRPSPLSTTGVSHFMLDPQSAGPMSTLSTTSSTFGNRLTTPPHSLNLIGLSGTNASLKPALLSPSQKKANHIQSEQKRRANIRAGYDALCDAVPALRTAIAQQEAEDAAQRAEDAAAAAANGGRRPIARRKRTKGSKQDDAEKFDGRAGPKSEYIVLQKTIEHLHELKEEDKALRQRLANARAFLNLAPSETVPLWDRDWTGGSPEEEDSEESE